VLTNKDRGSGPFVSSQHEEVPHWLAVLEWWWRCRIAAWFYRCVKTCSDKCTQGQTDLTNRRRPIASTG